MKKLIFISICILSFATGWGNPPLWIGANTTPITVSGGGDTAITINRVLLVEFVTFNGQDSTVAISYNQFRNYKQWLAKNPIATDVPTYTPTFKIPSGQNVTLNYILQQAKTYFVGLGYNVNIQ